MGYKLAKLFLKNQLLYVNLETYTSDMSYDPPSSPSVPVSESEVATAGGAGFQKTFCEFGA